MGTNQDSPIIAIDIGGTKISAGLALPGGNVQDQITRPTPAQAGGEAVMQAVIELAGQVGGRARQAGLEPGAVGIGTAGLVDPISGSISFATDSLPGWKGMPVRERMQAALGLPTFVDNDANAMALGEALFGAGRGAAYLVGITVGTGVGGGVVMAGRIYHGAAGYASNIGHLIIDFEGRQRCQCGRWGCLEAYASSPPIVADYCQRAGRSEAALGVKEIAEFARGGDVHAVAALQRGARCLGAGIATLLNLLNPDLVVVGGGVAQIGESYFAEVRRTVLERALPPVAETPILPALLGTQANLVGAAGLAWQE